MTPSPEDRAALYSERRERFQARAAELGARSRLVSNLRGLAFGIAVVSALTAVFGPVSAIPALLSVVATLCFIAFVVWHARVIDAEADAERWALVNRRAHARVTGAFRSLPEDGTDLARKAEEGAALPGHADDLDLFGRGSLFQRINVAHTHFGQQWLFDYLSSPASVELIRVRQRAVAVLAEELETRQRLEALALALIEPPATGQPDASRARPYRPPPDPEPLLKWAESEPELGRMPLFRWVAWALPAATFAGIGAAFAWDASRLFWAVPLFLQLIILFRTRAVTTQTFNAVSATEGAFLRYGSMLELLEGLDLDAEWFRGLQERLFSGDRRPSVAMNEFKRKVAWFDLRHNGLVHPIVNLLTLWDVHCVLALDAWRVHVGRLVRKWFLALGELEAISSFATLAYDEPGFCFPDVATEHPGISATGLSHPLLSATERVENDLELPERGTALLVTGSNMSGKSTLLRALGLAAVMAQCGAPVCAKKLRLAPCQVMTSIRVRDSLEGGISHFYAELGKLKAVVDATSRTLPVLFLLDELLHGTNSRERQIGARWVIAELLKRGAFGAVSTHDMELCQLPDALMQRVSLVHLRENVQNGKMTFDYKLRPGPVTAGNALRLMQLIGLEVPLE